MELFNIVYLGRDKVEPVKQDGTIKMTFDSCSQYIYKVDKGDPTHQLIEYMDYIVVPVKAPAVEFEEFEMEFDLFDGAFKETFTFDWQPGLGDILHEEKRIRSRDGFGEISVLYGLFGDATVANLQVKLPDNFADADVYGVVAACNSRLDFPDCTSMLFVKKPDNMTKVGDRGLIPLTRSRVGLPLDSKLNVDMSLRINGAVCKSRVKFDAEEKDQSEKFVDFDYLGNKTKIQVTVTWDTDIDSIKSLYDCRDEDVVDWEGEENNQLTRLKD